MNKLKTVSYEELIKACQEFQSTEGKGSFYDVALEIVDDHPLQASIILLATWNTARFRFMTNDTQNLLDLKNALADCKPLFE